MWGPPNPKGKPRGGHLSQPVASSEKKFNSGESLRGARREDDDDLAPHVRREIPNIDDAKGEVEVPEEVNKGTKRKRAPPTKGPCEHGVKSSLEVQGVRCLSARSSAL